MVSRTITNFLDDTENVSQMTNPQKDELMVRVAKAQHLKLGRVEQHKRSERMKAIMPAIRDIERNILDYDESFMPPFVCYHLMTTINNLTMLDAVIAGTPSSMGYNEDMSKWWMIYDDRESDEWVRIDIDGHNGTLRLTNSNETSPSQGWSNVSVADVLWMVRSFVTNAGQAPDELESSSSVF